MISKNIRNEILNFLSKKFKPELAILIEKSIYTFSNKYADENNTPFLIEQIYQSKSDELKCLLTNKNLEFLTKKIKEKEIDPLNIAFLKPKDIDFEKYGDIFKKKETLEKQSQPKGSDVYECEKCKKRNCSIREQQTRSGDEPATVYITCLECKHVTML